MMITKHIAKKPYSNGDIHYNDSEKLVWRRLYNRQMEIIRNRACDEFLQGLELLGIIMDDIPINSILTKKL